MVPPSVVFAKVLLYEYQTHFPLIFFYSETVSYNIHKNILEQQSNNHKSITHTTVVIILAFKTYNSLKNKKTPSNFLTNSNVSNTGKVKITHTFY